jgi:hypothetical protein
MLDLVEEAFDEVALAIEREVARTLRLAVGFRWDDGRDLAGFKRRDQRVGVVALVGEHRVGVEVFEERLGLRNIGDLSSCDRQCDGVAERVGHGVDLRRQAAARPADGLVFAVFFWAPTLC